MPGKNSTPPFQSKLTPFRKEILEAWFTRKTLKEIQASLSEKHGIPIALSSLSAFIKRSRYRNDPHDIPIESERKPAAKQPIMEDNPTESLRKLNKLLARDPNEVAREYDQKHNRQNKKS